MLWYFRSRVGKFDDPTNLNGTVPDMRFHHVMGSRPGPGRIEWKVIPYSPSLIFYFLTIPHALLAAGFTVAPLLALALTLQRRARMCLRERRVSQGHCEACGYDLRASRGRCPECGHHPPDTISTSDFVVDY